MAYALLREVSNSIHTGRTTPSPMSSIFPSKRCKFKTLFILTRNMEYNMITFVSKETFANSPNLRYLYVSQINYVSMFMPNMLMWGAERKINNNTSTIQKHWTIQAAIIQPSFCINYLQPTLLISVLSLIRLIVFSDKKHLQISP